MKKTITLKPLDGKFQHVVFLSAKDKTIRFLETKPEHEAGTLLANPGDSEISFHLTSTVNQTSDLLLEFVLITKNPLD